MKSKTTSIRMSQEFYSLAKKHKINFSEATAIGISMILAERGINRFDNRLNRLRKLKYLQEFEKALENLIELEGGSHGK